MNLGTIRCVVRAFKKHQGDDDAAESWVKRSGLLEHGSWKSAPTVGTLLTDFVYFFLGGVVFGLGSF